MFALKLFMANLFARRKQLNGLKEPQTQADPYRSQTKPKGIIGCPVCKSVSVNGRWASEIKKTKSQPTLLVTSKKKCPACKQLEDHYALAVVELHGVTWHEKEDQIFNTIRNSATIARKRNDQARILWIESTKDGTKVHVTLPELARHLGRELERSFKGTTDYIQTPQDNFTRVKWWSDLPHIKHLPGAPLIGKRKKAKATKAKSKAFRSRSPSLK
jgi:hypothetical protein